MSVDCAHIEGDWELFALGSLDEAAEREMAAHLRSGCAECQRRFQEAQAEMAAVATTVPLQKPSARVERELMKRVRAEAVGRSAVAAGWRRWQLAPWAFAAVCLLLAGWFFWQKRDLSTELAAARAESQALRQTAAASKPISQVSITQAPVVVPVRPLTSPPPQSAQVSSTDGKKLAELEAEVAQLQEENAAMSRANAAAQEASEKHVAELQSELDTARRRSDELARNLDAARKAPQQSNGAELAALSSELAGSRAELARLKQVRARDAQIENLLQSATMQQIELRAVDPGAGKASARALYSPQGGLLVVAAALPKLDHEKCYQLWLIRKGAPAIVSAGLLQTSDDGRGFLFAQPTGDLAQLTGLAITDEPKGGSVSARGHKLLFGAQ